MPTPLTPFRLWLVLAALITTGSVGALVVAQQALRSAANDPQIEMAEDAAGALGRGESAGVMIPTRQIDLQSSVAPFITVLDTAGAAIASSARLAGAIPVPPVGALRAARDDQVRITWAPRTTIRLATVIVPVRAPGSGWVVSGRSLRETESRISQLGGLIATGWLVSLLMLTTLVALLGRESRG